MNAERSAPVREHIDHRPEGLHTAALRAKLQGAGESSTAWPAGYGDAPCVYVIFSRKESQEYDVVFVDG